MASVHSFPDASFKAGTGCNTSTAIYKAVYLSGDNQVAILNTLTNFGKFIGILQDYAQTTGAAVPVRLAGPSKAVLKGASITAGDLVGIAVGTTTALGHVMPSTGDIATPSIGIRHAACNPYTSDAAIVAHIQTRTTITVRTAIPAENNTDARDIHDTLVASAMGCIIIVDETTGENALHTELNAVAPDGVTFSEARWTGNTNAVDDENGHFITRIELETIISPKLEVA
jgi:hypothetical protein